MFAYTKVPWPIFWKCSLLTSIRGPLTSRLPPASTLPSSKALNGILMSYSLESLVLKHGVSLSSPVLISQGIFWLHMELIFNTNVFWAVQGTKVWLSEPRGAKIFSLSLFSQYIDFNQNID